MESENKDVDNVSSDTDNETESIENDPKKSPPPDNDSVKHVVIDTDNEMESIDTYSRSSSYDPENGHPAEVEASKGDQWINMALLPVLLLLLALQASFLL